MSDPLSNLAVAVNELSTTIDLDSTLVRAEALFKRFQRLVDAVDKKGNFPTPKLRLGQSSSDSEPAAVSTPPQAGAGRDTGKATAVAKPEPEPEKVITPELRKLLSRQVEVLPRKEVAKHGDGVSGVRAK